MALNTNTEVGNKMNEEMLNSSSTNETSIKNTPVKKSIARGKTSSAKLKKTSTKKVSTNKVSTRNASTKKTSIKKAISKRSPQKKLNYLEESIPSLHVLIKSRLSSLSIQKQTSTINAIIKFLKSPQLDDYKLSVIANKMIAISADYDDYVSVSIFKQLPDGYTIQQLNDIQEALYTFIKSNIIGTDLDKRFTHCLVKETMLKFPLLDENHAKQKALGNWGWLLPHALMQLMIENVAEYINNAILDDKRVLRKGRIRIKKMK